MKRLISFLMLVVAMMCSTTMTSAQSSEAPQRYGWGYPNDITSPEYSLYFPPLYGDVESVTIVSSGYEELNFCRPFPAYYNTYIFNAQGDVVACVGQDAEGKEMYRRTWAYNDDGKVIYSREMKYDDYFGREVCYIYDSSSMLVGASVKGHSDWYGEFSHNVIVNKGNRKIIEQFGIDFFMNAHSEEIFYCPNGKIRPMTRITDRDFYDAGLSFYRFDCNNDGVLDIKNFSHDFTGYISFANKIFIGLFGGSSLYSFDSNNKLTFSFWHEGGDGPRLTSIYHNDVNGRLVSLKSYLCDGIYEYYVCEYDDDGKLIGWISYEPIYGEDDSDSPQKFKPRRVVNYVYDSHGNLIRLLKTDVQCPENNSSIEYVIRYRK